MSTDVLPVVLTHFRAPAWCRSAVATIAGSTGVEVDVVVADNSGELADDPPPGARVARSGRNIGYAGGANLGIRLALERHPCAPFVAVCSHDFHPEPGCFRALLDVGDLDPTIGVLAPQLTAPKPDLGSHFDGRASTRIEPFAGMPALVEPDWVSGTCMVVRTDVLRTIGGFDEGFGSYMEDVDLCLRVRESGRRIVTVTAARGHGMGSVSDARFRMTAINVALLAAKREGSGPARRLAARYALRAVRSTLVAGLPSTRDLERRGASLRYARIQAGAAWVLIRDRRIREYARDPHRYERSVVPLPADA
jgi:GT2 family glycosyltransferase